VGCVKGALALYAGPSGPNGSELDESLSNDPKEIVVRVYVIEVSIGKPSWEVCSYCTHMHVCLSRGGGEWGGGGGRINLTHISPYSKDHRVNLQSPTGCKGHVLHMWCLRLNVASCEHSKFHSSEDHRDTVFFSSPIYTWLLCMCQQAVVPVNIIIALLVVSCPPWSNFNHQASSVYQA
jgi:hypothetical protein